MINIKEAPEGYVAELARDAGLCGGCVFSVANVVCLNQAAKCLKMQRDDEQDVIFKLIDVLLEEKNDD